MPGHEVLTVHLRGYIPWWLAGPCRWALCALAALRIIQPGTAVLHFETLCARHLQVWASSDGQAWERVR